MPQMTRREFLGRAALAAAGPVALARPAAAVGPIGRTRPSHFQLSLAAYSFRDRLTGPNSTMDLFGFVDLAADLGLDAIEPTSYYFPEHVTTDDLHRLKRHAFLLGLDVSGTAVMNDFCLPPGPEADKELEHVHTWIDRAAELDAPTLRLLSGEWRQGTPDEELEKRVVRGSSRCCRTRPSGGCCWRWRTTAAGSRSRPNSSCGWSGTSTAPTSA